MEGYLGMLRAWTVADIARAVRGELPKGLSADSCITGIFTDSRHPVKGGLFVPLCGERFNGHNFVEAAFRGGAAISLWSYREAAVEPSPEFADQLICVDSVLTAYLQIAQAHLRRCHTKIAAVTGSVGKTTTKDLLAAILKSKYKAAATVANHNNEIGLAQTLLSLTEDEDWAVVEMGMRGRGEIESLAQLTEPNISVVTTIGESHLERLGTRENIALAKAELLDWSCPQGTAVLPLDCDFYPLLHSHALNKTVTFSAEIAPKASVDVDKSRADWQLLQTSEVLARCGESVDGWQRLTFGQNIRFACPEGEAELFLPIPGRHNCANLLAALAAGYEAGVSLEEAISGVASCAFTGQRLQIEQSADGLTLIDDSYNAAPSSTRAALDTLAKLPALIVAQTCLNKDNAQSPVHSDLTPSQPRTVAVLGDMLELGPAEVDMHRQVGEYCATCGVDFLLGVGKLSSSMVEAAQNRGVSTAWAENYEEAFSYINKIIKSGDCLLVKASHSMNLSALAQKIRDNRR